MTTFRWFRTSLAGAFALALLIALLAFAPGAQAGFQIGNWQAIRTAVAPRVAVGARLAWDKADPDGDHLGNWVEVHRFHTDPHRFDSDGDGYGDGFEVRAGTNPRSAASHPSSPSGSTTDESTPPASSPTAPSPPTSSPVDDPTAPEPPTQSPPTAGPPNSWTSPPHRGHPGRGGSWHHPPAESPSPPEEEAAPPEEEATPPEEEGTTPPEEGPGTPEEEATPPEGEEEGPSTPPADTTPPQTTIGSGPDATTATGAASFTFSADEAGSTFECRLDGGEWIACHSPRSYSLLLDGTHNFAVRAIDASGNVDPTPATWRWTVATPETGGSTEGGGSTGAAPCTQTLSSGANVSTAIAGAAPGSVVCLPAGGSSFNLSQVSKSNTVTVRGTGGTVGYSVVNKSSNLRFEGIHFTGGLDLLGATSGIQIVDNEFTGNFGIHAGGEAHSVSGSKVSNVLIEGNYLHDLNYSGSQGVANGYGITALDGVSNFVIRDNTIKSPASDYIQSASPVNFTVDHNTFLGPSLLGSHQDHQDLWQIFGGGTNIVFTNNVARHTETQESLLFQEAGFQNVVVENNLFDHDSRGFTCQIYQSKGLVFRDNTIVGSHWGCLFRDTASAAPGSGYVVEHNVFVGTEEGSGISTEGRAASWGVYDYNVTDDGSASGSHSVRNWKPAWVDTTNYVPSGLPFEAGFRP